MGWEGRRMRMIEDWRREEEQMNINRRRIVKGMGREWRRKRNIGRV